MPASKFEQPNYNTDTGTAYPLKIDSDFNVLAQTGVDYAPRAQDTPNMIVSIEAGSLLTASGLVSNTLQTTPTIVAPTSPNNRIDRVVISRTTGVLAVVTGTPAVSPVAPAIPADRLPICQFTLTPTTTTITNAMITDERTFTVGVGSMAFQNSNAVAITGGAITGTTFNGLTTGNASGNIPVSNGTLNINLNADLLNGFDASTTPAANIIPVHDASGRLHLANFVGVGTAPDTDHDVGVVHSCQEIGEWALIYSTTDNNIHYARNAKIVSGAWVYRYSSSPAQLSTMTNGGLIIFYVAPAGTAGDAISWVSKLVMPLTTGGAMTYEGSTVWTSANDGTGSGLDADLLRGISGAEYRHNTNTFHGRVNADGTAARLPSGWTVARISTGVYDITHSLGTANYSFVGTVAFGSLWILFPVAQNIVRVYTGDSANVALDRYFEFALFKD